MSPPPPVDDDPFDDFGFRGGAAETIIMTSFPHRYHSIVMDSEALFRILVDVDNRSISQLQGGQQGRRKRFLDDLERYINNEDFVREKLQKISLGGVAICVWIRAVYVVARALDRFVEMATGVPEGSGDVVAEGREIIVPKDLTLRKFLADPRGVLLSLGPLSKMNHININEHEFEKSLERAHADLKLAEEVVAATKKSDFDEIKAMCKMPVALKGVRDALAVILRAAGETVP